MEQLHSPFLLISLVIVLALVACGGEFVDDPSYDDEIAYEDEEYEDEAYEDEEASLTADDCYEDEIYDPETESCMIDISCEDEAECELILAELYSEEELSNIEFFAMSEDECLPGESYDPDEQVCYIECDTDEECDELAAEIYSDLDVYFADDYAGGNGRSDAPSSQTSQSTQTTTDLPDDLSGGDPELPTIARYILDDNLDIQLAGIDDSRPDSQINQDRHQEIWVFLRQLLPTNLLQSDVREYHIFTDGEDETLAYVSPLADDPNHWLIGIDIADVPASGKMNSGDFVHTVIHEFVHILTLEDDQVPPDTSLSPEEIEEGVESEVAQACATFYTGEGCALSNSYVNQFFNKFWADVYYNEFQDVEWAETDEEYEDNLYEFYEAREDWFVTEYAATNPGEDIAESFTYFVLQDRPTGNSIADQKVRFFYDYPTLVAIRNHIRGELARMK